MAGDVAFGETQQDQPQARLREDLFALLFAGCGQERVQAGQNLFMQDDEADRVYGVLNGTVEIAIYSEGGRKLVANIETAKSLIGEIGALDGGLRTATATCLTDSVLVSVSRRQLFDRIEAHPQLASAMIGLLCARLRWVSAELGDQALLKIEARLAKRLLFLSELIPDEEGWIRISQSELAEFLGATRESVNKTLTDWRRLGVIEIRRGGLKIVNGRALERIGSAPED
ncbi:Crp/Fnr family transcriptional regulator [Nitratireductor mangrovi]|uniref:Crp/Fnr family transcriptional regulator n=1 Tax=Nitratireductor mangrovi TaxID=2599600 RepID=A0A5B8KTT6_9HYPH|nr:Crp/Fnr family transcriptional regulator [Nitratireductor mangrovi]QDY98992.1 Crp/Fnr family transcriptional regulator [Nitratireductor mangrovi]